jgi:Asp-tRNA(Asn)/Glu-tRNA(Gln) amidotransferase A subunit family amidase
LHNAFRAGTMTPLAVAEAAIARRNHPDYQLLNAYIANDDPALLRDAEAATARYTAGQPLGLLDGIPVSIKDEFSVINYRTGGGTSFLGATPATADATPVARLRAAGALIIGKGQMHEIGLGVVGTSRAHGPARNPYQTNHTAGGSTGGGAAATASGLALIALGADGGGSIRIPAAFCGMVGLKATYGRISSHGSAGVVWSMSHPGPIAPYPTEIASAYVCMAGSDPADPATHNQPLPVAPNLGRRDLRGMTIGYMPAWFEHADTEIVSHCRSMLHYYRSAGAELREITVPGLEAARVAHTIIITSEMLNGLGNQLTQNGHRLSDETRLSLALSREFTATDIAHAQRTRASFTATLRQLFTTVDMIATPTAGLVAPVIDATTIHQGMSDLSSTFEIMRFAFAANLSGLPSISIPAGYTKAGLPVGFQLMARPWKEALLIEAAQVAEQWRVSIQPKIYLG